MALHRFIPPLLLASAVGSPAPSSHAAESVATTTTKLRPPGGALNSIDGVVTMPLVPHRALLERRRRELRETGVDPHRLDGSEPMPRRRRTPGGDGREGGGRAPDSPPPPLPPGHQQVGALYQGYGTHYVDLWVGTPPQRQTVIVDTGSGITAFPCSGCANCGESYHTDGYFVEAESSTFEKLDCKGCYRGRCSNQGGEKVCRISMSYQEGSSWSAYEGRDVAYAGGPHDYGLGTDEDDEEDGSTRDRAHDDGADPESASDFAFRLTFGCQVSLTGLFKTQLADGIMGMDNAGASFWAQMHDAGSIAGRVFSLCFGRSSTASRGGTLAGALTLGGKDDRLHTSPVVYSKNVRASGFYTVRLKKMYLREGGGIGARFHPDAKHHLLNVDEGTLNSGGVIVDSGTTDTYMSRRIGNEFKKVWKDITGQSYTHDPVQLTEEQLESLPTVLLQIEAVDGKINPGDPATVGLAGELDGDGPRDVLIAMPASHYMEYDASADKYVARLYLEEGSGSVLGANLMMGHDVIFDVDAGHIGWAESECDYGHLVGGETESEKRQEGVEGMGFDSAGSDDGGAGGGGRCGSAGCVAGVVVGVAGALVAGVAAWRYFGPGRDRTVVTAAEDRELDAAEGGEGDYDDGDENIEAPVDVGDGGGGEEEMRTIVDRPDGRYADGDGYDRADGYADGDDDLDGFDERGYDDHDLDDFNDQGYSGEYHDEVPPPPPVT